MYSIKPDRMQRLLDFRQKIPRLSELDETALVNVILRDAEAFLEKEAKACEDVVQKKKVMMVGEGRNPYNSRLRSGTNVLLMPHDGRRQVV